MKYYNYPGGGFQGMGQWNDHYFNNGQNKTGGWFILKLPILGSKTSLYVKKLGHFSIKITNGRSFSVVRLHYQ